MVKLRDIWQKLYPYGVFRTGTDIYLTFDDGPIPEVTPQVLAILARYDIKATFFMVGENIDKYPDVFAQVLQAGHSIGNHTYNHLKGWNCSKADYLANVQKWEEAVHRTPYTIHRYSVLLTAKPLSRSAVPCINSAIRSSIGTSSRRTIMPL